MMFKIVFGDSFVATVFPTKFLRQKFTENNFSMKKYLFKVIFLKKSTWKQILKI